MILPCPSDAGVNKVILQNNLVTEPLKLNKNFKGINSKINCDSRSESQFPPSDKKQSNAVATK